MEYCIILFYDLCRPGPYLRGAPDNVHAPIGFFAKRISLNSKYTSPTIQNEIINMIQYYSKILIHNIILS